MEKDLLPVEELPRVEFTAVTAGRTQSRTVIIGALYHLRTAAAADP